MSSSFKLTIVVPVYCEQHNIIKFAMTVEQVLLPLNITYQILFVDDGSTDQTWQELLWLTKRDPKILGMRLTRNFGKEAAIAAGLETADGDAVVIMDVDLQHPPELLPEMIALWRNEDIRVVQAVKQQRQNESFFYTCIIKCYFFLFKSFTNLSIDGATDFKLLDRQVVDAWKTLQERTLFFRGMTAWLGFESRAIPFIPPNRELGQSKWSWISLAALAASSLTSFSSKPLLLIWIWAKLFFIFAIIVGVDALRAKFAGTAFTGFTTVYLLELIIGGSILFCLGLIATYLKHIYDEVKLRPRYLVACQTTPPEPDQGLKPTVAPRSADGQQTPLTVGE
ncbi:MAG: glycosyltransferase family 2 protein [Magnetococcales bacterium]|nr:glycosyltransferase family 2 protein [Magnetococcales bacterium]NGZ06253.1 glycosyltransferase family 2 protein [Magnetococcales bacterium]